MNGNYCEIFNMKVRERNILSALVNAVFKKHMFENVARKMGTSRAYELHFISTSYRIIHMILRYRYE